MTESAAVSASSGAAPTTGARTAVAIRRVTVGTLLVVYVILIAVLPFWATAALIWGSPPGAARTVALAAAPLTYLLVYVLVCGMLARLTLHALVPGRFPRDLGHAVYGPRRLYAMCWAALYYHPPIYHAVLSIPWLKKPVLRSFGYRGALDATFYPDGWIRDLPLLKIGSGAYIGNRSTLGTNICTRSGFILVGSISIGARTMIGHESIVGLGDDLADDVEVGVRSTFGMNVRVGAKTRIGALVGVNHGATIGARCRIESMSYIGQNAVIHDGVHIRYASVVPDNRVIHSQFEADLCAPWGADTAESPALRANALPVSEISVPSDGAPCGG